MLRHAALIAACIIGVVVGYCLPHTPALTDIKDGENYAVATFLEDSKNAGSGVFVYDGGHSTASNKQVIDSPVKHAPLHDGANYIVKFSNDSIVEWYRLK